MNTEDTPTDPHAPPPLHVESGEDQFKSTLRSLLDEKLRPITDAVLVLDARQKAQGRALVAMGGTRIALPVAAFVLAVATLALVATLHSGDSKDVPAQRAQ